MLFLNGYESITSGDTTHDYDVLSDCTYVYTITVSSVVRQESEEREQRSARARRGRAPDSSTSGAAASRDPCYGRAL